MPPDVTNWYEQFTHGDRSVASLRFVILMTDTWRVKRCIIIIIIIILMSYFKAKMHKIRFPLSLGGAYSAPSDPLAVFKGPTYKGRAG